MCRRPEAFCPALMMMLAVCVFVLGCALANTCICVCRMCVYRASQVGSAPAMIILPSQLSARCRILYIYAYIELSAHSISPAAESFPCRQGLCYMCFGVIIAKVCVFVCSRTVLMQCVSAFACEALSSRVGAWCSGKPPI
jgi:hypothetical protein